jgi:hypothetical protein
MLLELAFPPDAGPESQQPGQSIARLVSPAVVDTGTWTFTNRDPPSPAPVLHKGCCVHTRRSLETPVRQVAGSALR